MCAGWARAHVESPDTDSEERINSYFAEEHSAQRALFLVPARATEIVWQKLEAFENILARELVVGHSRDCILMLALGSIKTDFINLGIGGDA
jgi:hypothetical protein